MHESLTADDVRLLESCYARCSCASCTVRREVIAKALRIIGAHEPKPVSGALREAWVNGSWEDVGQDATESGQPKDDPL
jgi:hypothetical protein